MQFSVKFFIYINLYLRIIILNKCQLKLFQLLYFASFWLNLSCSEWLQRKFQPQYQNNQIKPFLRDQAIPKYYDERFILLVFLTEIFPLQEDSKKPGGGGGWPPKPTCAFKHTIYAVDRSGSMSGPSWERVQQFLAGSNILAQYKSLFSFYLTWPAVAQIQDYYTIAWNPVLPPTMYLPNGGANYDDALHRASQILSQNFPTSTCLILLSDGWQSSTQSYLDEFIAAKNDFTKKTGCPVCVMCYLTMISHWGKTPFEKMCEALKAPVFQLEKAVEFKGPKINTIPTSTSY